MTKLAKENKEWMSILNALVDLVVVVSTDYNIVQVNKATARTLNVSPQEIIGKKYWEIIYGASGPVHDCPLMLAEKTLKTHEKEIQESNLGGTFILTASLIIGEEGQHKGYCLTLKDLTKLKREQRKQRQAEKLDAIGTLSGIIAHEFNNLLTGIQGTSSLLMGAVDPKHPHFKKLSRIEDYIEAGHELTKQLLGFSVGSKYELESTDVNSLVNKQWETFLSKRNNVTGQKRLEEELWYCEVDPGQIEQVFVNIFNNAYQAMPAGGELLLETENIIFDRNYADFFGVPEGNYVKVTVTDSGDGMDDDTQEMIFDPFFTTRVKGRGLGLAFARQTVTNHKGLINIYSEKGHGTTVNIYLPASTKENCPQEKELVDKVFMGTETILLVDDEKIILEVGSEMLREMGHEVHVAAGGREAVEVYKRYGGDIDLVILDMIMPDMDGGQTYDQLRAINKNIKVLLASGYSMTSRVSEILRHGFNGFIQKPFNMVRLSQKIRGLLEAQQS